MSNIMHRLNWKMHPNNSEAILPCQHFDLMGGSGTGGLIAIMLAKLRMSAEEAAEEFSIIAKDVFIPVNITPLERTQNLRKSLKIMITKRALPVDMKLEEEISVDNCACFVVANPLANLATNFCLRSYSARGHRTDPITVIEAALATCATRSIFEPVTVGADFKRKEYAGVGLGASNPIREVISEASSLFGGTSTVETLLSVGTGHPGIIVLKSNGGDVELNRVMQDIMTDCNQKAKEVEDQIGRAGIYFRFSVEHGMQPNYGSEVMNPAWIVTQTGSYLDGQEVKLDELTQSVGAPATVVTVDQLS
ncbi:hypothetical protein M408DRAFT_252702 [Serendipita vermifera MAFF 305830]|uniref:PNPLA domain-containing protein n=1 Tax=Serendipita vermifera MAFF 305830 TaxID=933852 RepID=A0A0C3AG99_SERVB|nr:hypothetical protein M408DRAFT_252702 [Serendipita vermifera MAFF 305830]